MPTPALLLAASFAMTDPVEAAGLNDAPEPAVEAPALAMSGSVTSHPAAPLAITPERVARIRAYNSERLTVRDETELRGATNAVSVVQPMMGPAAGPSVVVVDPVFTVQTWGVYRGHERLAPAELLRTTGETFRADDIERRIERDHRKSRRWMMLAGMGAASVAAGVVQYDRAQDLPQQVLAHQLTFGGIGVGLTGLMGASFPASRATRLERYPSAVMDRTDAQVMVERHNKATAQRLGLTEEDLLLIELADAL